MVRALVLSALGLLAAAAPATAASPHVVGGVLAGDHPEQAQLSVAKSSGRSSMCGGTLIDRSWVLTAAHCVTDDGTDVVAAPEAVAVRLGSARLFAGTAHAVDLVLRSPDWDQVSLSSDAALVHLVTPATQAPVAIAGPAEAVAAGAGTTARVVGWGQTGVRAGVSLWLREADVPVIADAVCGSRGVYGGSFEPATMLCAGGSGADACFGDSGGPLLTDVDPAVTVAWRQLGIVSWGEGCGSDGFPGVYTDLAEPRLRAWIAGTLAGDTVTLPPRATPGEDAPSTPAAPAGVAAPPTATPATGSVVLPRSCARARCRVAVDFPAPGLAIARLTLPRMSVTRGVITLARSQVVARAAGTHRFTVAPSRRVRRALRRQAVRVRLAVELYVPGAPVLTARRTLRLRAR